MSKAKARPFNGPSTTSNPSGKGRGNNPPKANSSNVKTASITTKATPKKG